MTNPMSLAGKAIMVTGAGQGVGRGVAQFALELGARVCALDLKEEGLRELAASSEEVLPCTGSVTDPSFVQRTAAQAISRFGRIDGLVNCAGIIRPAMIEKMTLPQWQEVIDVHLTGAFLCLQAVGTHMVERAKAGDPGGSIVNISSGAGRMGTIGQINYATAKAGMFGMTMAAAREWAKFGVRTNSISLGVVETPMTEVIRSERFRDGILARIPLGRFSKPAEVAQAVCFLLSEAASYIVGQNLSVDGGSYMSA